MENIWVDNLFSWIFFGTLGLVNVLALLLVFGAIYAAYLALFSVFLGKPWKVLHGATVDLVSSAYSQSVIAEAIGGIGSAIAFTVSHLARGLILPLKLLSGWWVNLLLGPVEKTIAKGEDLVDEMAERDAERQAKHTEAATKRHIRREIQKARLRQIKKEAKDAKADLRLPDFSGLEMAHSDDEIAIQMLVQRRAEKCEEAFESGGLANASVKSICDFLGCSQAEAKSVRSFLHKKGTLVKLQNGHMKVAK